MLKCRVCSREALRRYCELHEKACSNIIKKYEDWRRATEISWKEYLNEIVKNAYTGCWAKEVAEELMKNEG